MVLWLRGRKSCAHVGEMYDYDCGAQELEWSGASGYQMLNANLGKW